MRGHTILLFVLLSFININYIQATCQEDVSIIARQGSSWVSDGVTYQVYDVVILNSGTENIISLDLSFSYPSSSSIFSSWNYDTTTNQISNFGGSITPGQSFSGVGFILAGEGPAAIASSSATCPKKLKILCLHGFYMSAAELENMLTPVRAYFSEFADLEFIDGAHTLKIEEIYNSTDNTITTITTTTTPSAVPPIVTSLSSTSPAPPTSPPSSLSNKREENGHFAWWHTTQPDFINLPFYLGINYSIDKVARSIWEKGPFDGVLGFSQGGTFTSFLVNRNQFNFKFAIIWSAYAPAIPEFKQGAQYNTIPSLHIYGNNDTIVDRSHSIRLSQMFHDKINFEHEGGHFDVPANNEAFRDTLSDFFTRFEN